ncbi:hypothetical protein, partial [Salmonella enterica]|uniref:hypothetical protein n=1 Tax=Salmonella enterica TaxID=28901 RepID=UPI0020CEC789
ICDGYDHNQTPVRADSVWSLLTLDNVNQLDGGWLPVPTDIFRPSETGTDHLPQDDDAGITSHLQVHCVNQRPLSARHTR